MTGYSGGDTIASVVQGICPAGWHIPSDTEWEELAQYVSDQNGGYKRYGDDWYEVGKHLKGIYGWDNNGSNDYGFTGLPAGLRTGWLSGNTSLIAWYSSAYWWSSTENGTNGAWCRNINDKSNRLNRATYSKHDAMSVRCVKDE